MTEYGTIKVPKPAYEHHNEIRKELDLTWEQYLNQEGYADTGSLWTEQELRGLIREEIQQATTGY